MATSIIQKTGGVVRIVSWVIAFISLLNDRWIHEYIYTFLRSPADKLFFSGYPDLYWHEFGFSIFTFPNVHKWSLMN